MSAVEAIGWPLVHFIWQGSAVALILALVLELLRRRSAGLRYIISTVALGIMALLPAVTALTLPDRLQLAESLPAAESEVSAAPRQAVGPPQPPSSISSRSSTLEP